MGLIIMSVVLLFVSAFTLFLIVAGFSFIATVFASICLFVSKVISFFK